MKIYFKHTENPLGHWKIDMLFNKRMIRICAGHHRFFFALEHKGMIWPRKSH